MPTAAEILAQPRKAEGLPNGIVRPVDVVSIAAAAGLELAVGVATLIKESGGGRNVWGHDGVPTGGAYVPGGEVTKANYGAYEAALAGGRAGPNGCGALQLTFRPFQMRADERGGCWRWEINVAVGFEILAGYVKAGGVQNAGAQYNGGSLYSAYKPGHPARVYADDLVAKTDVWRSRLAGATTVGPESLPDLVYGMRNHPGVEALQLFLNAYAWRPALPLLPVTGNYLADTAAVLRRAQAQMGVASGDGRNVGPATKRALWSRGFRG